MVVGFDIHNNIQREWLIFHGDYDYYKWNCPIDQRLMLHHESWHVVLVCHHHALQFKSGAFGKYEGGVNGGCYKLHPCGPSFFSTSWSLRSCSHFTLTAFSYIENAVWLLISSVCKYGLVCVSPIDITLLPSPMTLAQYLGASFVVHATDFNSTYTTSPQYNTYTSQQT